MKQLLKQLLFLAFRILSAGRRKPSVPESPARILVLAAGYMGDAFWAIQILPELRRKYPEAEIDAAVRSAFAGVLLNEFPGNVRAVNLDSVVSDRTRERFSPFRLFRDAAAFRREKYDLAIDLVCNRYSALFLFLCRTYSVGSDLAGEAVPLYSFSARTDSFPERRLPFRPFGILRSFTGTPMDFPVPPMIPPVPAIREKKLLFSRLGIPADRTPVLLLPGAGWSAKRWPPEKFRILAGKLREKGFFPVAAGSPAEREMCREIAGPDAVSCSLSDTVSLIPHCGAVVGNDTGLIHIAESSGVRCVTLYCATNRNFSACFSAETRSLQTRCPLAPAADRQYCGIFPETVCVRGEFMGISPDEVLENLI